MPADLPPRMSLLIDENVPKSVAEFFASRGHSVHCVRDVLPAATSVVGELIKAASKNPTVKAAGGELGKAAHTIAKTVNIALLPLTPATTEGKRISALTRRVPALA